MAIDYDQYKQWEPFFNEKEKELMSLLDIASKSSKVSSQEYSNIRHTLLTRSIPLSRTDFFEGVLSCLQKAYDISSGMDSALNLFRESVSNAYTYFFKAYLLGNLQVKGLKGSAEALYVDMWEKAAKYLGKPTTSSEYCCLQELHSRGSIEFRLDLGEIHQKIKTGELVLG